MSSSPICIELELVRSKEAEDAFAFRFARQSYLVRGRQGSYETVELPWSRDLLADLEHVRRPDRDPAVVASVGALLRELLTPAGWAAHETSIVEARGERRTVHVTVRSAAAELYALPWELLTLRADGQHLGALDHVLLRYAWPGTSTVAAQQPAPRRARVLVAWSAAGGGVPASEHVAAIKGAAADGTGDSGRADVEVLPHANYGSIADALAKADAEGQPFSALHVLCHGAEAGSTFGLCLDAEGDDGRPVVVDAGRLQQLLAPYAHTLRLVVVSACDGGNMGELGNRIGSVAQRLHRGGIAQVIASRYPLSARGSTRVAEALYAALFAGRSVERAFVEARSAAAREVKELDWASLQLYARPEDGDAAILCAPQSATPSVAAVAAPAIEAMPIGAAATSAPLPEPVASGGGMGKVAVAVGLISVLGGAGWWWMNSKGGGPESVTVAGAPDRARDEPVADTPSPADPIEPPSAVGSTTGAEAGGSSGSASSSDGNGEGFSGGSAATKAPSRTVRPSPATRTPTEVVKAKTPRCPSAMKRAVAEAAADAVKAPASGSFRVDVVVRADGSLKLGNCKDCGDMPGPKGTVQMSGLVSSWKENLPCKTTFNWE